MRKKEELSVDIIHFNTHLDVWSKPARAEQVSILLTRIIRILIRILIITIIRRIVTILLTIIRGRILIS
jgi:hypothetical protein